MAVLQFRGSFSVFKNWERNNDNLSLTGSKAVLGMSKEFSILKNYILPIPVGSLAKIYSVFILVRRFSSVQFSSVAQSCPTLCNPMTRSTPGLPVHHQLPEFTQSHVHRVSDAIQPSHPLLSPSPPDSNPSQHQSLFQ